MDAAEETEFRRSGRDRGLHRPFVEHWYGRLMLLVLSTALLTLSFAPIGQFYLAWVGLIPWLIVVSRCSSYKSSVFWGWLGGFFFFLANMWWMWFVTPPGMVGLMAVLAIYWGAMGAIVYGLEKRVGGLFARFFLIPFAWTALEFIRGNFIWKGLPWLYLGHTQSPMLAMCQIADFAGVYGITFWVVLLNTIGFNALCHRFDTRNLLRAVSVAAALSLFMAVYGLWRYQQTATTPGPTVAVVQPNIPQANNGDKGAPEDQIMDFHEQASEKAVHDRPDIDLVVWSETIVPAINENSLHDLRGYEIGQAFHKISKWLRDFCWENNVGVITGGLYVGKWTVNGDHLEPHTRHNSAYFVDRSGLMSDLRYDKVHIVPFGEFIPFRRAIPFIYHLFVKLGPPDTESYQLSPGSADRLTVFPLRTSKDSLDLDTWRFVTPICFEDLDSELCRKMFRPGEDGRKRADVLVNLTNDGWFRANEMGQHLQAAVFRSIENRVPTARSVNTGISGFVDSLGRTHDLVAAGTAGTAVAKLGLDPRVTFYTLYGDVFAWICVAVAGSALGLRGISR